MNATQRAATAAADIAAAEDAMKILGERIWTSDQAGAYPAPGGLPPMLGRVLTLALALGYQPPSPPMPGAPVD